jgi:hypothetical protein
MEAVDVWLIGVVALYDFEEARRDLFVMFPQGLV